MTSRPWPLVAVDDLKAATPSAIAIGPFGSRMKSHLYTTSGIPVVRGTNISDTQRFDGDFVYVGEETANGLLACNVYEDDLVFPHRGAIGSVGIVTGANARYVLSTSMMKLTCDRSLADARYVFYFFRSTLGQHELLKNASQVGTPGIATPLTSLKAIRVPLPPLAEQRRIATILGALDAKIEVNRHVNRTLESIARALFRSWFIDHDPAIRRLTSGIVDQRGLPSDLADLYPRGLDTTTGLPRGWRQVCLQDIIKHMIGGDWGSSTATDDFSRKVRCLRGADIPLVQDGGLGHPPTRYLKPTSLAKRQLQHGDLVVEVSGGGPTQSTGRCALVRSGMLAQQAEPLVCSNFCRVIRPVGLELSAYVYLWLRWVYDRGLLFDFENGTTGIKNLAIADFAAEPILSLPPSELLAGFNRRFDAIQRMRESLFGQSQRLAYIRDELLPHLLNGPDDRALG
jgi:type I restriction enzyme, S subunit